MTDAEADGPGLSRLDGRAPAERRARQIDLAAQRVAGGPVPLAAERRRGGVLPLGQLDLDGVAVGLDAREPLPCRATKAGGDLRVLGTAQLARPMAQQHRAADGEIAEAEEVPGAVHGSTNMRDDPARAACTESQSRKA